jgi:hypothetical protein
MRRSEAADALLNLCHEKANCSFFPATQSTAKGREAAGMPHSEASG